MPEVRGSKFGDNIVQCPDWRTIRDQFDQIPKPERGLDDGGEIWQIGWIFRGHKKTCYPLQPSIERAYPYSGWNEAEYQAFREFQSKAALHMDVAQLPRSSDRLGWLAIMQHYGAPTRLLDFTYSPYVALYFALRQHGENESDSVDVWALDAASLRKRAIGISRQADKIVRDHRGRRLQGAADYH